VSQQRALFRQEALDFQRLRQSGEVVLLQPVATKLLFWSLAAIFAAVVGFLVLAQFARKETVVGYLAPTAGVAKVLVARAGTIIAVHVRESEAVEEGQPLLTVAIDQTMAGARNVIFLLGAAKSFIRWRAVAIPLANYRPELRRDLLAHLLLWPVASLLYMYNAIVAGFSQQITWRGITYQLKSPREAVIISRDFP